MDSNFDDLADAENGISVEEYVESIASLYGLSTEEQSLVVALILILDNIEAALADAIYSRVDAATLDRDSDVGDIGLDEIGTSIDGILAASDGAIAVIALKLPLLVREEVSEALDNAARAGEPSGIGMTLLMQLVAAHTPHRTMPAVHWLRGRAAEVVGDPLTAESAFEEALGFDSSWTPALESLAAIANDRGDAERGLNLLQRAGVSPDDGPYRMLTRFSASAGSDPVRRNDPCWCGSGRKLKRCHRTQPPLPLAERASWLWHKAVAFLQDGPWRTAMLELATERAKHWPGDAGIFRALFDDPLVMSAMLWEGGVLATYAEHRGELLPADEFALLQRWLGHSRTLVEVEDVKAGEGMHVRDVRDGSRMFVQERLGSRDAYEGMQFSTLLLPTDEEHWGFYGGIEPVRLDQRTTVLALLDGDADEYDIVEYFTRRQAPPTMRTTTGEDFVICETVIRVQGKGALIAPLKSAFARIEPNRWAIDAAGQPLADGATIGAELEVDGRRITINTVSVERMEHALEVLSGIGLDYEVIRSTMTDPWEAAQNAAAADESQPTRRGRATRVESSSPADPELAAYLEQYMLDYERTWLDESIPALDGFTPREAAADPTRRGDLIALINSFPPPQPGTMNRDRLRAALDLN